MCAAFSLRNSRAHLPPLLWPAHSGDGKFVNQDKAIAAPFEDGNSEWIPSPNDEPLGSRRAPIARYHGDFDDDRATLHATLVRIVDPKTGTAAPRIMVHEQSEKSLQAGLARIASKASPRALKP